MTDAVRYKITLRIAHPSLNSKRISDELGLTPAFAYTAGDKKITPKGTELPGTRKESFWRHEIAITDEPIELAIMRVTVSLAEKKWFLRHISETGGRVEYFIGWFTAENSGFVLAHSLLGQLSDVGIDLSFDIYPEVDKGSPAKLLRDISD
jgi:hypothetical protein